MRAGHLERATLNPCLKTKNASHVQNFSHDDYDCIPLFSIRQSDDCALITIMFIVTDILWHCLHLYQIETTTTFKICIKETSTRHITLHLVTKFSKGTSDGRQSFMKDSSPG